MRFTSLVACCVLLSSHAAFSQTYVLDGQSRSVTGTATGNFAEFQAPDSGVFDTFINADGDNGSLGTASQNTSFQSLSMGGFGIATAKACGGPMGSGISAFATGTSAFAASFSTPHPVRYTLEYTVVGVTPNCPSLIRLSGSGGTIYEDNHSLTGDVVTGELSPAQYLMSAVAKTCSSDSPGTPACLFVPDGKFDFELRLRRFGDTNSDSLVNVDDLLNVINQWGVCEKVCDGDLDGNGLVDVDDLLEVINQWDGAGNSV